MRIFNKILAFFPVPFWVYFLSILASTLGLLPHQSPAYDWTTRHVLPVAIILMLIGTPLTDLLSMGPKAFFSMVIATTTIFFSQILSFLILIRFLPDESWKAVGALMGTWIGGSANMVAVKEIIQLPDGLLGTLVIVDTVLSYSWMALLLIGASFQKKYDRHQTTAFKIDEQESEKKFLVPKRGKIFSIDSLIVLAAGFLIGEITIILGKIIGARLTFLPLNGWILLTASTVALLLALTSIRKLQTLGSYKWGTLCLYVVLITIGAKTTFTATLQAPVFFIYGALSLLFHGGLCLLIGRIFNIPLFLLSTASQANIGGAVSAPIVAEAYRPETAHVGVLMAILGAVLGTYLGVAGGFACRTLGTWLQ